MHRFINYVCLFTMSLYVFPAVVPQIVQLCLYFIKYISRPLGQSPTDLCHHPVSTECRLLPYLRKYSANIYIIFAKTYVRVPSLGMENMYSIESV